MQEKNNNSPEAIKDILDNLKKNTKQEQVRETEFVFGEEENTSALVFDDSDDDEAMAETLEPEPQVKFETVKESEPKKVEFSVPEKFEVNKKYDTPTKQVEDAPRIITTYVPRFTEISDTYRMAGDTRPKFTKETKGTDSKESANDSAETIENIDPTAEIYAEPEVKVVNNVITDVKATDEEKRESASTVFKFAENEISRDAENTFSTNETVDMLSDVESEAFDDMPLIEPDDPKEYSIPDPVDEPNAVIDYTVSSALAERKTLEDAPESIGDAFPETKKGKITEYTSYAQRDAIKDGFLDSIMSVRVRFWVSAAITLVLLIMESMFIFGVDIPRILNLVTVPGAMALIDMQFVVCLYLIALPETVSAVKYLIKGKATPELFLTASFAVSIVYTLIITIQSPHKYALPGLLFAVYAMAAIGATYFKKRAEYRSFISVSTNGEKKIIDKKMTRTLEVENSVLDGLVEEHKSKISRIFRTVFVSDFFKRCRKTTENSRNVILILASSFGAALVTAVIAFFIPGGWVSAASSFALVFMISCPAVSLLVHKTPFYYSVCEAESENSAVIGEKTLLDYSGIDVVTFKDTEVFGEDDVTIQRIMLYGRSDNLTKALRQMSALFMNAGGPLDRLFSNSLDRKCAPAQNPQIHSNGVSGEIDGNTVLSGTMDYMLENGMRIPEDEGRRPDTLLDSTKVIYAAENGAVYAKFYIRYSFSEEFSMLLPTLEDEGITPLVYTRDPLITNELLNTLTAGADKIRVVKLKSSPHTDDIVYRKISSGMVTHGNKSNAINMILLCKRYARLQSRLAVTELLAVAVGGGLAIVLSLGGMSLVPSFALALWQAAWCGVLHFISAKTFNK